MATLAEARSARQALDDAVADVEGVVGVGITRLPGPGPGPGAEPGSEPGSGPGAAPTEPAGREPAAAAVLDDYALQVNLADAAARDDVPDQVAGVRVRVRVVGRIGAGG